MVQSTDAALAAVRDLDANPEGAFGAHIQSKRERLVPHLDIDPDRFAFEKIADAIETMLPAGADRNVGASVAISQADDAFLKKNVLPVSFEAAEFTAADLTERLNEIIQFPRENLSMRDIGWSAFVLERH